MNNADSTPAGDEDRVETLGGGVLVEFDDTDPSVLRDLPHLTPEENIRHQSTTTLEEYLEAGYFNEETARLVRAELERRKKEPPATP